IYNLALRWSSHAGDRSKSRYRAFSLEFLNGVMSVESHEKVRVECVTLNTDGVPRHQAPVAGAGLRIAHVVVRAPELADCYRASASGENNEIAGVGAPEESTPVADEER